MAFFLEDEQGLWILSYFTEVLSKHRGDLYLCGVCLKMKETAETCLFLVKTV